MKLIEREERKRRKLHSTSRERASLKYSFLRHTVQYLIIVIVLNPSVTIMNSKEHSRDITAASGTKCNKGLSSSPWLGLEKEREGKATP